jgi:pyruvate/2-oxoglutarate dehydrogenase complex dihydrolipoamide acyltransferase (E2) component
MRSRPADRKLDYAERWMRDSLAVLRPPFAAHQVLADMTNGLRRLDDLRKSGVVATPTHLLIHATARALAANPDLHEVVGASRHHYPAQVDIGLSTSGEIFVAPVLVIERADQKTIAELAEEIARRVPEVRKADEEMLAWLRKWGWTVPFAFLRRSITRRMFGNPAQRRKVAGTFQVTTVPLDWALTSTFVASGVLVGGQVAPRVVAVQGQPAVRPVMTLTLCGDHGVWDGRGVARLLSAVKVELEASS